MSDHDVVLYGNDASALTQCVVPFIATALQDHGGAIVIASDEHERAFRSALAALALDPQSDALADRLVFLNANELIKALVVEGRIERARFSRLVGNPVRRMRERYTVHAYGEMVGILRSVGRPDAAAELEHLWAQLLNEVPFHLICGYPIDVLGSEFHPNEMELILTSHTKLISVLPHYAQALDDSLESAFGSKRAAAIRGMIEESQRPGWATLGPVESTLLWMRRHLPEETDAVIGRARAAFQE